MDSHGKIDRLAADFAACSKILTAIDDETRQHLILEMMKLGECGDARVGEITARTNLSRPAVSHHLQILKDAGVVKVRKDGTRNYYYFDREAESLEKLARLLELATGILKELPERGPEDE